MGKKIFPDSIVLGLNPDLRWVMFEENICYSYWLPWYNHETWA